ncbi:MAG: AAA family ATPase, partial [Acidobacteriota bacterium]|nr:AAA family ATPase [Acidobacteriota bacterium]
MSMHSAVCPVQVGRDAEVVTLARLCAQRTATLIGGEAGVGKSRLAAEALRLAAERGMVALVGHCTPEGTLPYAPFATALRRRTRTMERAELDGLFADAAFLSAALLPEVARAIGVPTEAPNQADLFAGVWQVLARLAGGAGAVLVLEDLHWADVDSLRLLSYLVREAEGLPVWIVGTYRVDELHRRHPLTAVLGELTRERLVEEIRLAPLSREQLRSMVSAIFDGTEVGDEFVDALLQRTDGNPFFVEELIKVLLERGDIYRERDAWERREVTEIEMPESVRDTLLARVRGLDEATLDFLRLAAISGERLDLAVLARATGSEDAKVDDILREGLRLQILVERRDDPRTPYAFRHALTCEALADELVGPDRQHAHQRVADALAAVYRDDLDAVSASLADHFTEAGDTAHAIEFGVRAARRAASSFAMDEAGRLYDRALRLIATGSPERLGTLLEAAEALADAPDRRLAVAFATQAREVARQRGDAVAEVRALDVLKTDAWQSGDTPRALQYLLESREIVRGVDDAQEAMVLARLTRMMCLADQHAAAGPVIDEGIALAESSRNYRALSILYGSRLMTAPFGPQFEDAMDRSLAAARDAGDPRVENNLLVNAGFILLWTGDLHRSRELLRRASDWYATHLPYDRSAEAGLAWAHSLRGEYGDAERLGAPLRASEHIPPRIV